MQPEQSGFEMWWNGRDWDESRRRRSPPQSESRSVEPGRRYSQADRMVSVTACVGFAMLIAGSLMPWARLVTVFGALSVSGMDGDGQITLVTRRLGA